MGQCPVLLVTLALLRRPCFTTDGISGNRNFLTRTMVNRCLQRSTDIVRCFPGNHLTHNLCCLLLHHRAVIIHNLRNHIGLHQIAAVNQRRKGSCHLDRGAVEGLPEGACCQLNGTQLRFRMQNPLCFARQVNACFLPEAEFLLIFIEFFRPQLLCNLNHTGVTGLRHDFLNRKRAVSAVQMAVDISVSHRNFTAAIEGRVLRDYALLQCRRYYQRLINRTGFVGIADAEISPYCIQIVALFLIRHGIPCFLESFIRRKRCRLIGVIQVKGVRRSHRVDFPRIWVHHDCRHVLRGPCFHGFLHRLLGVLLNVVIQCCHNGIAVLRLIILIGYLVRPLIQDKGTPGRTRHFIIIIALKPPCVVEANQMAG